MKKNEIIQILVDMEKIDFYYDNMSFVALYNESNCSEAEALQAIKEENFRYPKIAVMTKEQWQNIFPIKDENNHSKRKKGIHKKDR